jgi:hypothetical protein
MNFLLKMTYSILESVPNTKSDVIKNFNKVYKRFFTSLSKQTTPSKPDQMNSKLIKLKIYEEAKYPFGDCVQLTVKHTDSYNLIEQKISEYFDFIPYFSIIHINFEENITNISESEEKFKKIIAGLDGMHTYYDEYLEVKLFVKEETITTTITIRCSGCQMFFNVENSLENRTSNLLCLTCQNAVANMVNSKKNFQMNNYFK